jgi:hypothetical protein
VEKEGDGIMYTEQKKIIEYFIFHALEVQGQRNSKY